MTEKTLLISFSLLIIVLAAMNFNEKWNNKNYEKLKDKKHTWYWFKVFKVSETKENLFKLYKGLSIFVIIIQTITIIFLLTRK
jgi:type IV secretory pathway component VirB8